MVHVRLHEWRSTGPSDKANPGLANLALDSDEIRALAATLAHDRILEVKELRDGIAIRTFAHVGRLNLGSLVITIEPKIDSRELLELVRYAYGLRHIHTYEASDFATVGKLFQDLLVDQLIRSIGERLARGLARTYVRKEEPLANPRGRFDLLTIARNLPLVSAELQCRHHLRSSDHVLNRVLLCGLHLATETTTSPELIRNARRLALRMHDEVTEVPLTTTLLDRARASLNRLTGTYEPIIGLVDLLYQCRAISLDGETTCTLPGFLFDMNRFFQALLGRFLREHLPDCQVGEEYALRGMMRYVPGLNPRKKRPPLPRPDFVVRTKSKVYLLDAKYRDLWEHDLPRSMLYQLAMYALSQPKGAIATILFPTPTKDATEALVEISDPLDDSAIGYVALRPVIPAKLLAAIDGRIDGEALALSYVSG